MEVQNNTALQKWRLTGTDSYIMRIAAVSLADMERIKKRINMYGKTRLSIGISTPIAARGLTQPPALKRA